MVDRAIRSTVNWHNEYYHADDRYLVAVEMPKFRSIECSVESQSVVRRGDLVRAEELIKISRLDWDYTQARQDFLREAVLAAVSYQRYDVPHQWLPILDFDK